MKWYIRILFRASFHLQLLSFSFTNFFIHLKCYAEMQLVLMFLSLATNTKQMKWNERKTNIISKSKLYHYYCIFLDAEQQKLYNVYRDWSKRGRENFMIFSLSLPTSRTIESYLFFVFCRFCVASAMINRFQLDKISLACNSS